MSGVGWYARRRGAGDHLATGSISLFDNGVHDFLCMNAQSRVDSSSKVPAGVWIGSAQKIWLLTGRQGSEREIQRSLQKLERIGWIKRWVKPGQRGDYPILISKFVVTEVLSPISAPKRFIVNASATMDWRHPILEPAPISREVLSPLLQELKNKDKTQNHKKRGSDPRFTAIVDHYYAGMRNGGIEPSCDKSDFGALNSWLKKNPSRTVEDILGSLSNALGSTDHYPLRPGFRLREFLEHEAKYQRGPLIRHVTPVVIQPRVPATASRAASEEANRRLREYGVKGVAS